MYISNIIAHFTISFYFQSQLPYCSEFDLSFLAHIWRTKHAKQNRNCPMLSKAISKKSLDSGIYLYPSKRRKRKNSSYEPVGRGFESLQARQAKNTTSFCGVFCCMREDVVRFLSTVSFCLVLFPCIYGMMSSTEIPQYPKIKRAAI